MTKSIRSVLLAIVLLLLGIVSSAAALKILSQFGVSIGTLVLALPGAAAGLIGAGLLWELGSWAWERVDEIVKRAPIPVPRLRT
jgi:hypothetical protein